MNIYVGNVSFKAGEEDLRKVFSTYGEVSRVSIIMDQATGRSRGFAFVEMVDDAAGKAAIAALNGKDMLGRALTVNEARPRPQGGGGGGGGGYRDNRG